jgi:hypothetical protein
VILYGDEIGWEAALFDHFQAMVTAIGSKVTQGKNRADFGDDRACECPNEPTPAVDSAGNCYFLGDCIPNGLNAFRPAPADHPCVAALGNTCGT